MEGRALSPDMVFRDSEEPGCSGGVLPDASTGQGPGTLARKLSRCKEGMAHFLPADSYRHGYKVLLSITRVAIQV
jgi:hypothetical protein